MVKKHIENAGKKYKEAFTRTGAAHEPEDHHIATMMLLLILIVFLLCGVIFLLLQEMDYFSSGSKVVDASLEDVSSDYTVYRYTLSDFERIANMPLNSLEDIETYMLDNSFEEVSRTINRVSGRIAAGCYEDRFRGGNVCRTLRVTYEPTTSGFVEVVEFRELLPR